MSNNSFKIITYLINNLSIIVYVQINMFSVFISIIVSREKNVFLKNILFKRKYL